MPGAVMIDGQLVPPERAVVSVFDRGFLYGDSVFETLRTYHRDPFALDAHLERLRRSAERVLISMPVSTHVWREEVAQAIATDGSSECYVRLMLTRGIGQSLGLDPELSHSPCRVLLVTALKPPASEIYERGIAAITFRAERPSDAPSVADAKIGNYLLAVLAAHRARSAGAAEALLEDGAGNILEGSTSNVLALFGRRLVTAPPTAAILPGITRAQVLEIAVELGLDPELRAIPRAELLRADEVFITSSIREIVPVVKIDGQPVGGGAPGPSARELLRRYRERAYSGARR